MAAGWFQKLQGKEFQLCRGLSQLLFTKNERVGWRAMNLLDELRAICSQELSLYSQTVTQDQDLEEVLENLLTIEFKCVDQRLRNVEESSQFQGNLANLDQEYKDAYSAIKIKIERGDDIVGHLSKQAITGKRDNLLFAWSLHHVHLSISKSNSANKFYDRSDWLVFVIFTDTKALVLDVRPHSEADVFARQDLLAIMVRTWPDIVAPFQIQGIGDAAVTGVEDKDLKQLWSGGVNLPCEVDGKFYHQMGGGITTAGTSNSVGIYADMIMQSVADQEKQFLENEKEIRREFSRLYEAAPSTFIFRLRRVGDKFVLVETTTDCPLF